MVKVMDNRQIGTRLMTTRDSDKKNKRFTSIVSNSILRQKCSVLDRLLLLK